MRHGKRFNHLSRTSAHRKAMLGNMASSLIIHKRIKTTVAKAKALRTYIEPLITKSKTDSTHSRRVVFSYLKDKDAVTELFREISVKVADRPGGYTRIIKIGPRQGDNAEMALIELVDFNENLLDAKAKGPKKTRRRKAGGAKKQEGEALAAEQTVETAEEVVEESTDTAAEEGEEKAAEETAEAVEEVKEEPKAEVKEVAAEEAKEEPKAEEVKEEPKAEEKKEEAAEEDEKEKDKKE
ncbi:MAG: 50S ribosomal protein L17 [Bacteroidota bacterium]